MYYTFFYLKKQSKQKPTEVSFWDFLLPRIPAPVVLD